ncbi:MAG TPA: glycosyltransferase family 39 protein [Polyangiaceae bacterium]|nr:glycosyltransferase family 39 protein [Polyangiaceae bacterium]
MVVIWAAAYVGFALWWTRGGEALPPDSMDYAEVTRSLLRGQGATIDHVIFNAHLFPRVRHALEVHGMLVPLELAPLFALFGAKGELVRIPSIVLAGATGALSFFTARRLFGAAAGLVAAALVLGRDDFVFCSVLGADDVGAAFFALLSLYCFLRTEPPSDRRWIFATGVACALASLQKMTGPFLPLALAAVLLLRRREEPATAASRRDWLFAAIPVGVAFSLYVFRNVEAYGALGSPYGWLEWFGKDSFPAYFAYYPKPFTILSAWRKLGYARVAELTMDQVRAVGTFVLTDPVFAVGLPSLVWLSKRTPRFALTSLSFGAGILFLVCVAHHLEARYLAPLTPLCAVATGGLAAHVLAWAEGLLPRSRRRWPALAGGVVLAALALSSVVRTGKLARDLGARLAAPKKCADALDFVRRSGSEAEPVITANSWYVAWETERPAINAPTNGPDALAAVARHYGARWLFTGAPVIGGLDLAAAVREPAVVRRLRPELRFDGADCDVYRIDPSSP